MPEITLVELPKLYENMDEATIGPWRVPIAQHVKQGEPLVELITDKTVIDFEAPCDGVLLAVYAQEKSTVPLGYTLCALGPEGAIPPDMTASNDEKLRQHLSQNAVEIDIAAITSAPKAPDKPVYKAAPAAKVLARQKGVCLDDVAAFTKRDMIHRKDVEDFIAAHLPAQKPEPVSAPPGARIEARVAIVTGASGAIGSAIARALARSGCAVAIHCNSGTNRAQALVDELNAAGSLCALFTADLTASGECKRLVDEVLAKWGRVDILVNNAGRLADATVSFMSDEQWTSSLELNLSVPFRMLRAVSMVMAHQRWGRIVNMASDAGRMGAANRSNYAAAKAGLVGLTRSAARELAGLGVRVNAVSPGFVESPMTDNINPKKRQELIREIPVHRLGKPEDIAALVNFLCSEDADYITGQVISIDGGLFMG